jgi:FdhD protein
MMGVSVLAAVSAPTVLALEEAEAAGLTVAGIVRDDGLEVFTHPMRLDEGDDAS